MEPMPDPATQLLHWYEENARVLPWRVPPGAHARPDPYRVWLSEIMLQQTTVATVIPYFEAFIQKWPVVGALADAPLEEVLTAWAGLGYYARARNLHACARMVAHELGGIFPDTEEGLRALPGIGDYTAAAIAAIAFGRRAVVVDGNVERVMARFHGEETPLPRAKPLLKKRAAALTPCSRAGDYAQAVMDLGATVCTPRNPKCGACPLSKGCAALGAGDPARLPLKEPKAPKPTRQGLVFWLTRPDGAVLIRQRERKGLLAHMPEFPSAGFNRKDDAAADPERDAPVEAAWQPVPGVVRHTFTHFHLELTVLAGTVSMAKAKTVEGRWVARDALEAVGLPTVMRKVADHVLDGDGPLFRAQASG